MKYKTPILHFTRLEYSNCFNGSTASAENSCTSGDSYTDDDCSSGTMPVFPDAPTDTYCESGGAASGEYCTTGTGQGSASTCLSGNIPE